MFLKIDDAEYEVAEHSKSWSLRRTDGKLTVNLKVSKKVAPTIEDLKAFVAENMQEGEQE